MFFELVEAGFDFFSYPITDYNDRLDHYDETIESISEDPAYTYTKIEALRNLIDPLYQKYQTVNLIY